MTNSIAEHPLASDTPALSEAAQLAFFDAGLACFEAAHRKCGGIDVFLDVAGTLVRLQFAGTAMMPHLVPALAHLVATAERDPDVTFSIWDTKSTGISMVRPPCPAECFTDRGDIWGMSSQRIRSAFHWTESAVNIFDRDRRRALYWVPSDAGLPFWSKASPLRTLFHWWMEMNGKQLLHAAAVGDASGALLITGKGGVGKSTTALACLEAGMHYIGDDYVVVQVDPEPRVFSLYSTAKLDPDQVARFPRLRALVTNERALHAEKAVMRLFPVWGDQIARSLPLVGVATPSFGTGAETSLEPIPSSMLERATSFTTMSQLPHAGRVMQAFVERLVREVPTMKIVLGSEVSRVPDVVRRVVQMEDGERRSISQAATASRAERATPLVSVVIPVYNGANFLPDAVDSVLRQAYPALEIIVVDDGSPDDIAAVVRALPVDVRLFRQVNCGPAAARNRGIRDAAGELVAFLDVDDLWPDGSLDRLVEHLVGEPAVDVVHGHAQVARHNRTSGESESFGSPLDAFPFYIGAGIYRRRAFELVGLFDPELRFSEDTDWFRRATERSINMARVDDVTLIVRRHDTNSTRGKSMIELETLRVFKKALDRRRAASAPASAPVTS